MPECFCAQALPAASGRAAADDGVRAQRAGLEPLQVHGPATAAAVALGEPEDLGERALQNFLHGGRDGVRGIHRPVGDMGQCLREELVVTAVRAVDAIGGAKAEDRADRAALLADARMRRAMDETRSGELEHALFECADEVKLHQHRLRNAGSAAAQSWGVVVSSTQSTPVARALVRGILARLSSASLSEP